MKCLQQGLSVAKDVRNVRRRLCPENLLSRSHHRFVRRSNFAKGPNYYVAC